MKPVIVVWAIVLLAALALKASEREVQASSVPACEAINQAGAITVYRCEPEWGPPYLLNSVGFMVGLE